MQRYNPKEIEPKWQQAWDDQKIYQATEDPAKPKKYILEYFPYPSGAAMHVGHVRNYTIGDVLARHGRMQGFNVLHPMGWDGFGLPAENYAIKNGISPRQAIDENTDRFKRQLTQMGFSYDWSREIDSTSPDYYRWTQWFFLLLFRRGLAYQQESLQWWCPVDKTVLANEQVEAGLCWRCGNPVEKKALKQWFFKITDYADRLASDLDEVNWSDSIKSMQRNWIGRSKGAEIDFQIAGFSDDIKVFTTRPDTLFGATFMVMAPEHPLVDHITTDEQQEAVQAYVRQAQAKSDVQRQETDREKTGVFTGAYAINPINDEHVPIWIADYVLYGYGTGAIMAVPAHDERDYDFARKFGLPVRQVVSRLFDDGDHPIQPDKPVVRRRNVHAVVKHPTEDKLLMLYWTIQKGYTHIIGGVEDGEDLEAAARREIVEETGYKNLKFLGAIDEQTQSMYFAAHKGENRHALSSAVVFQLEDLEHDDIPEEELQKHRPEWVEYDHVLDNPVGDDVRVFYEAMRHGYRPFADEGVMINSGKYDGKPSSEARDRIVADLEIRGAGKEVVNYKIRDWLISRQRYWGAPIPIVHCAKDGPVAVPEDQLPVCLPDIDKYEPSGDGRSPLATVPEFVDTTCPQCGGPAQRETDTMDGFACSSWYFLRFADPHNADKPFDADKAQFWLPVDDYIGGAEHAVMHLLYARMWTKVMQDEGLIDFSEPFTTLRNHGMILAPDGQKMSKSKGNTIEPDFLIEQGYGADAIRIMELFIGPWNQSANWSVEGMGGAFRFLQRVWTLTQEYIAAGDQAGTGAAGSETDARLLRTTHRSIRKVSEDLHSLSFNTSIAALMETVNELYRLKASDAYAAPSWRFAVESLLQLLAPFAPHITEELWSQLGHGTSVHLSIWPVFDEAYLVEDAVTIVVQVNGKVRAQLQAAKDASQDDIVSAAKADANVQAHTDGKEVVKTVFVPGKLVNFVVKA